MQSVSSGIWTRVAVFISYDDNNYTTGTPMRGTRGVIVIVAFIKAKESSLSNYLSRAERENRYIPTIPKGHSCKLK